MPLSIGIFAGDGAPLALLAVASVAAVIIASQFAVVRSLCQRHAVALAGLEQIVLELASVADAHFEAGRRSRAERDTQINWICETLEELRDRETLPLYLSAAGGTKLHVSGDGIREENLVEIRVDPAGHAALLDSKLMAKTREAPDDGYGP